MTKSQGETRLQEIKQLIRDGRGKDGHYKLVVLHNELANHFTFTPQYDLRTEMRTLQADYAAYRNGGSTVVDFRDQPKLTTHYYAGNLTHVLQRTAEIIDALPETETVTSAVRTLSVPAPNWPAYASRP